MLALLAILLAQQDWQELAAAFKRIDPGRLALALLLMFVSRTAVAVRWHALLRQTRTPIRLGQSLRVTYAGLFSSNFLPTTIGGDVVRLFGAVQIGINAASATASLVMDRLVGMAGMALLLPISFTRLAQTDFQSLFQLPASFKNKYATSFAPLLNWLRLSMEKTRNFIQRTIADMSLWLKHPGSLVISLAFTLIHQVALYTAIWLLLDGMGEPIGWLQIGGIWSFVYFVTLLPISINGYGLQELSATLLYSRMGGISIEASITLALLVRTLTILVSLPGALSAIQFMTMSRKDTQLQPSGSDHDK